VANTLTYYDTELIKKKFSVCKSFGDQQKKKKKGEGGRNEISIWVFVHTTKAHLLKGTNGTEHLEKCKQL